MNTERDPLHFLGPKEKTADTREETQKNLKLISRIRWVVVASIFGILGISSIFGFAKESALSENQLWVNGINGTIILILDLIYAYLLKRLKNLQPLILFQIFIDVVYFTLTIYKTGSYSSPFAFLYFFAIFSTAILSHRRATFLVAGGCSISYSLLIVAELLHFIPHQDYFSPLSGLANKSSYIALSWIFSVFSCFAFAALASYLVNLLRQKQVKLKAANHILDKKIQTLLLLHKTSKALNAHKSVQDVANFILSELLEYLHLDRALLYINNQKGLLNLFMVKHHQHPTDSEAGGLKIKIPLKEDAGLTAASAIKGEAFNIKNPKDNPYINKELAEKIGFNPFALSPLQLRGRNIGVIGIDRNIKNGHITEEEFQILQMFANQAAITIDNLGREDKEFRHYCS